MTPDANDLCVFAVKRGMVKDRIDTPFNHPKYQIVISKLKKSLHLVEFGEVIESLSGGATPLRADEKQYAEDGIKFLRIQNITPTGFDFTDVKYITESVHNTLLKRSQLAENDLLMTITGRIGTSAVVDSSCLPANINQHIVRIRLKKGVNPFFAAAYLNSDIGLLLSNRSVTGTTRLAIDYESIKKIPFPIVSDTEQIALQNAAANAIQLYLKKLEHAESLLAGMNDFIASTLNIANVDYNARVCSCVRLSNVITDNTFSAEYYHPERMAAIVSMNKISGVRTMKLGDLVAFCRDTVLCTNTKRKYLGLAGVECHTGELSGIVEDASGKAFKYESGDILYGRLRPYLNKVLLAETSGICSTEFHVMRIKVGINLLPGYLSAILRSDLILSQTKHMMTGNTHPRISNEDVKNLYIPVPELPVQYQIEEELNRKHSEARKLKQQAEADWAKAKAQFEKELLGE